MIPLGAASSIAVPALTVLAALGTVIWMRFRRRPDAATQERMRRVAVNNTGRMAEATILDATEDVLYYSYTLRGVQYSACQDVSTLREWLPADPSVLIGPATVKYSPANPANSIVLCEEWSGLRRRDRVLS